MSEVTAPADTVTIEIDGVEMQAPKGSMIIEAADKAGIAIPRFCYHKKLSIAANCRMCLVDVEKAPKPLPACATPVMDGMKVYTQSKRAVDAQHGVMEFLLINHPLDCPICDQGGECELQDLAMGYGRSVSRFTERKRVVKDKNVGPLVQTDMTRCIHCTRCVRFLEEIAGTSEMGGTGRGDRLEIGTAIETSIDSELSGNIIDLCPVGALTNKPFRYSARAWELRAVPTVAAHDGVGSHLEYHHRRGRILRAVPAEHEATNESWLPDRDRYSHFGLYAEDRVTEPLRRVDGEWRAVSWDEAIEAAAGALRGTVDAHGADALGVLMSPSSATEDFFLAQRLVRGLGSGNIDHRLRERDFRDDAARPAFPDFERPIAGIATSDAVLLLGSNVRHEAPILGHRVRQAWRAGATVDAINPVDWEFHFDLAGRIVAPPPAMVAELAALASAVAEATGQALPDALAKAPAAERGETHAAMARRLVDGERALVLLGQAASGHPDAAWLRVLARWVADATGAALNILGHGANAGGAWRAGAVPGRGPGGVATEQAGLDARAMLETPRKAYVLWGVEPSQDFASAGLAQGALSAADTVIAVAAWAGQDLKATADLILPLAPWPEAGGTLVNHDGVAFAAAAAGRVSGEARPGWKILRRLGAALGLEGFSQVSLDEVRGEFLAAQEAEATAPGAVALDAPGAGGNGALARVGEVPMYSVDALCRRSQALQRTAHAARGEVRLNAEDARRLGLSDGGTARVVQGDRHVETTVRVSERVPAGGAWLVAGTDVSAGLGDLYGDIRVEVA